MKHTISIILAVAVILSVLTGCGAPGKQASTIAESEEGTVLTVRIENQSAVNLYGIAASYSAEKTEFIRKWTTAARRIYGNRY